MSNSAHSLSSPLINISLGNKASSTHAHDGGGKLQPDSHSNHLCALLSMNTSAILGSLSVRKFAALLTATFNLERKVDDLSNKWGLAFFEACDGVLGVGDASTRSLILKNMFEECYTTDFIQPDYVEQMVPYESIEFRNGVTFVLRKYGVDGEDGGTLPSYQNAIKVVRAFCTGVTTIFQRSQAVGKTATVTAICLKMTGEEVVRRTNSKNTQASDYLATWQSVGVTNFDYQDVDLVRTMKEGKPLTMK
eukprot:m.239427 g.239427  ORF g.239427 m.239427 type:complete len:249 (+) comp13937_c0_seq12:4648-5394(+)